MKKLSNNKENTGRKLDQTYFHLSLALSCARVVFRENYMLEAEHQQLAYEITSFSRVLQTPERGWTFEKSYLHGSRCKNKTFLRNQGTLG